MRDVAGEKDAADVSDSWDFVTKKKSGGFDVTSAQGHGVVAEKFVLAKGTTRNETCLLKPVTWGSNLSILAAEGEADRAIAASSGFGNRE